MGWQFTVGEWVGGVVLIAIMSLLLRLTYPDPAGRGGENARRGCELDARARRSGGRGSRFLGAGARSKDPNPHRPDVRDGLVDALERRGRRLSHRGRPRGLRAGRGLAGRLREGAPPILQAPLDALVGPLIAVVSFVCSIGNVPMAAVLWAGGVSFGGVLSFLYADLIVLPLLDAYRRYYGWRMAAYIAAVFYATMVISGLIMELAFQALGLIPKPTGDIRAEMTGVQPQLHVLAQSAVRSAGGVFHQSRPEASDATWARSA
jgi:hypothetical protein